VVYVMYGDDAPQIRHLAVSALVLCRWSVIGAVVAALVALRSDLFAVRGRSSMLGRLAEGIGTAAKFYSNKPACSGRAFSSAWRSPCSTSSRLPQLPRAALDAGLLFAARGLSGRVGDAPHPDQHLGIGCARRDARGPLHALRASGRLGRGAVWLALLAVIPNVAIGGAIQLAGDVPQALMSALWNASSALPRLVAGCWHGRAARLCDGVLAPHQPPPELWRGPPDEHGHRSTARYLRQNWLPPRVGDPATLDTYSRDYGSRTSTIPTWSIPSRASSPHWSPPSSPPDLGFRPSTRPARALAAACFLRPRAWPIFVPLLLSPQIWYIFSYFNSDGPFRSSSRSSSHTGRPTGEPVPPVPRQPRDCAATGRACSSGPARAAADVEEELLSFVALLPRGSALVRFNKTSALLLAAAAIGGTGLVPALDRRQRW
jgi:hypothetical protein